MRPVVGKVPGWSYEVAPASEPSCAFCKRSGLPVVAVEGSPVIAVCEPCSMLLAWIWRDQEGLALPGAAYPTHVGFALVLVVRERPNDVMHPFDVLMVERKDEPGAFGLPGGKVEPGETDVDAAVRELSEETGLQTWAPALEILYAGYSPRTALGRVFLCRGYEGEAPEGLGPEGLRVAWRPWPPGDHARHLAGYYVGVALAFDARWRAHRAVSAQTPLSLRLGEPAVAYLERRLEQLSGRRGPDDGRMLESFSAVMSGDEQGIVGVVIAAEERRLSLVAPPPRAARVESFAPPGVGVGSDDDEEEPDGGDGEVVEGELFGPRTSFTPPGGKVVE